MILCVVGWIIAGILSRKLEETLPAGLYVFINPCLAASTAVCRPVLSHSHAALSSNVSLFRVARGVLHVTGRFNQTEMPVILLAVMRGGYPCHERVAVEACTWFGCEQQQFPPPAAPVCSRLHPPLDPAPFPFLSHSRQK
jgi:hypothetical protein